MIYTSYFGKLKSLPKNIVPVAICGSLPEWYHGAWYKKLAPTWKIWKHWNETHDEIRYRETYFPIVLSKLNQDTVVQELNEFIRNYPLGTEIALICYEKPEDFCHRHLVAEWLQEAGYQVQEYN